VKLDQPRALSIGENITLSANVRELIFLVLRKVSLRGKLWYELFAYRTISALIKDFNA